MKEIHPHEMMGLLHALSPEVVRFDLNGFSLDMLREVLQEHQDYPQVHALRAALGNAVTEWDDEYVRVFLVDYFAEPPLSTEFQEMATQERRKALERVYAYLFDWKMEKDVTQI